MIEKDPAFSAPFFGSLSAQGRALFQQLEFDVRGNHLLENLRALLWLGLAFEGPEARTWYTTALHVLEKETDEQILSDGGHFERVPGYHVVILRDYLEMALLLELNAGECPAWLRAAVRREAEFLQGILGPGNRLPLLKDTTFDAAGDATDILNAAAGWLGDPDLRSLAAPQLETFLLLGRESCRQITEWSTPVAGTASIAFPHSGFYVARGGFGEHLVIDAGKPCPDYLPAHAHADTLSYEYHADGRPMVVDSGVFEYRRGEWRDFFRSTRAHNTLEIAGENSSEVWGSFRAGRRARPRVRQARMDPTRALVLVEHDGYSHLKGRPLHRRGIIWRASEFLLIVDLVESGAVVPATSFVHLHPSLRISPYDHQRWRIEGSQQSWWLHHTANVSVTMAEGVDMPKKQGWYSERFGERRPNPVLALSAEMGGARLTSIAYAISRDSELAISSESSDVGLAVQLNANGRLHTYRITRETLEEI